MTLRAKIIRNSTKSRTSFLVGFCVIKCISIHLVSFTESEHPLSSKSLESPETLVQRTGNRVTLFLRDTRRLEDEKENREGSGNQEGECPK